MSRDRALLPIYQLTEQIMLFVADKKADLKHHLVSKHWWSKLAYLADVFGHLNMLNTKMQGKNESVLTSRDKMVHFSL